VNYAPLIRRFGAILYDSLLLLALLFPVTSIFIALNGGQTIQPDNLLYKLTLIGTAWLFFVGFWSKAGKTLGMQAWGLTIKCSDQKNPNLISSSIRFLVAIISWLFLGFGFWWYLWDKNNQTWHDKISKTSIYYHKD